MKLSAQEEYGLRCLLQVARRPHGQSVTIPEIADAEGVSPHNVARYLGTLRKCGIVDSERGQHGGYTLTREPSSIVVSEVLSARHRLRDVKVQQPEASHLHWPSRNRSAGHSSV